MVKDEPVSLTRQTIYAIIPILDIYASYRVKRLRKYLLITILVGIGIGIANYAAFPPMSASEISEAFAPEMFSDTNIVASVAEIIGQLLLQIYLVRRWSKEWNKKFEPSSTESTESV